MDTALDEVKKIVSESALSGEDKKLLTDRLMLVDPAILDLLQKVLKEDPKLLSKILASLKEKIAANGDERKLENIARREEKEILKALK